jgi:hypothetical protein
VWAMDANSWQVRPGWAASCSRSPREMGRAVLAPLLTRRARNASKDVLTRTP